MYHTLFTSAVLATFYFAHARAESHTVRFENKCGHGTPQLVQAGKILSDGSDYTSNGPLESAIAYLQTGPCLLNGEFCSLVEFNMNNPGCPGCGSSVDISLIPSHELNVETAFAFYGGDGNQCDGLGASCADADCHTAFHVPDDNQVQRACQSNNVNLLITFCGGLGTTYTDAKPGSLSGQPPAQDDSPIPSPPSSSTTSQSTPNNTQLPATTPSPSVPVPSPTPPPTQSSPPAESSPDNSAQCRLRNPSTGTGSSSVYKRNTKRSLRNHNAAVGHRREMFLRGRRVLVKY